MCYSKEVNTSIIGGGFAMGEKVMVGMSGGVDSSAAAALLLEQGYAVSGATLRLFRNEEIGLHSRTCCSLDDVADARAVADKLGIRHYVFSFDEDFRREVIDRFAAEYAAGRTPNPCIDCNRRIKFSKMLARALTLGFDKIATGHYARITYDAQRGRYLLWRAAVRDKDQSYVLYSLTQFELAHTLFPLGGMSKPEIRAFAESRGLVTARKPDSQDICFVPDGDYARFLEEVYGLPSLPGDFIDTDGRVIGHHPGQLHYTVGQRKGLGVSFGRPIYVLKKDAAAGTVTLGDEDALFSDELTADDVNWIACDAPEAPLRVTAKTRYSQTDTPATVIPCGDGRVRVCFDTPVRAVTAGQAVVFYDGDLVVGGGTILESGKRRNTQ